MRFATTWMDLEVIILSEGNQRNKISFVVFNIYAFPGGASVKEPTWLCRRPKRPGFDPWVRKIPWRRTWQPTPVFLPEESHAQSSLAGYRPQGCKELDAAEVTEHACMC